MWHLSITTFIKIYFCFLIIGNSCTSQNDLYESSKVFIEQNGDSFSLIVNDEAFYVKGAGGSDYLDKLADYGGNSIRTWGADNAEEILDEAYKHGIMVTLGLWVGHERHGFDYNDEEAVLAQLEKFRPIIKRHKDHPALLMWAIGNEYELNYSNTKVWDAVNDIALMIKEEDPNHPTMTVVAEINPQKIQLIQSKVPNVDILGVNTYGGIETLTQRIKDFGWEKPYMITEWGPNGHWEVGATKWNAPLEQSSTEKREAYYSRYKKITADAEQCLGSYVFLWGNKQEVTPTWYGLFLAGGQEVETMDAMYRAWNGEWPETRAPSISDFTIDGNHASSSIYLQKEMVYNASVMAEHHKNEALEYSWEMLAESSANSVGGDFEEIPDEITDFIIQNDMKGNMSFVAPSQEGAYRLFIYVTHPSTGKAATANIPFFVN